MTNQNAVNATQNGVQSVTNGVWSGSVLANTNGIVAYNGTNLVNYAGPQLSSSGFATNTTQPCFNYYVSTNVSNVTGDGTTYQVIFDTMIVDNDSNVSGGVFTAPVTGNYLFSGSVGSFNYGAQTQISVGVQVGSNGFTIYNGLPTPENQTGFKELCIPFSVISSMTSGQTAFVNLVVVGGTKTIAVLGQPGGNSFFSGCLLC